MSKPRVAITVDVEAHPIRAPEDHVNRLIWGRQEGREAGIQTMMDIADRHDVRLTFFLDYPEYELYGESLLDVGREIVWRGHDLQPHCHAEYLLKPLFGLEDEWAIRLPTATREQADRIVEYLLEKHAMTGAAAPAAYRSGAYLIGVPLLDALHERGIRLDASYNLMCPENPFDLGLHGGFRWSNGLLEAPVPLIPYFQKRNHLVPWNFNHLCFRQGTLDDIISSHKLYLKKWFERHGDASIATLVMHSWSFWQMSAGDFIDKPLPEGEMLFDALLAALKEDYEITPLGAAATSYAPQETVDPVADDLGHCPICFEGASHYKDYGFPRRLCAFCGSAERQRVLADLIYEGRLGPWVFTGKRVLHPGPDWCEKLLLRRMQECDVTTLDIKPGCDIQADLQRMPEITSDSYDVVLVSGVFRHLPRLRDALAETWPILRPGGLLICNELAEYSEYTQEVTDEKRQTEWYGAKAKADYGIATWRNFGKNDWMVPFQEFFYTRQFECVDKTSGYPVFWMAATPKGKSQCAA